MNLTCPSCKVKNEMTAPLHGPPGTTVYPGAVSICMTCGNWSVFDDDLSLRTPTAVELLTILSSPTCDRIHEAWEASYRFGLDDGE
jgi:hypothetical protein